MVGRAQLRCAWLSRRARTGFPAGPFFCVAWRAGRFSAALQGL